MTKWRPKIWHIDAALKSDHIQVNIKIPIPSQGPSAYYKAKNWDLKNIDVFCTGPSKSRQRAKTGNMGKSKTSAHIQMKIKIPNPSQEPPASSKAPYQDLKDRDVRTNPEVT